MHIPLTGVTLNKSITLFIYSLLIATIWSCDHYLMSRSPQVSCCRKWNGDCCNTLKICFCELFQNAWWNSCLQALTLSDPWYLCLIFTHKNLVSFWLETPVVSICCTICLIAMMACSKSPHCLIAFWGDFEQLFGVTLNSSLRSP